MPDPKAKPAPPKWTVVSQAEVTEPGPSGSFERGVQVSFRLSDGTVGSVFVPQSQYTPERVRALIDAKAETMAAVAGLTG